MSRRRLVALALAGTAAAAAVWLGLATGPWDLGRIAGKVPAVILDEAFAAARPGLARALELRATPLLGRSRYTALPLATAPGAFVAAAAAAGFSPAGQASGPGGARAAGIVASPLLALAMSEAARQADGGESLPQEGRKGLAALGGAVLATPEWQGPLPEGLATAVTDRGPAYRAAGRAAGAWIRAARAAAPQDLGGSAVAAILFRPGPSRPSSSLAAFTEGYAEAGLGEVLVETMGDITEDEASLESALSRLLAQDIRLVLVAIGPGSRKAVERLSRPGIAVGLDSDEVADAAGLPFAIVPDDLGLARALTRLAGAGAEVERLDIPALFLRGSGSKDLVSGSQRLSTVLSAAGARAP